jgi:hypothetical protein
MVSTLRISAAHNRLRPWRKRNSTLRYDMHGRNGHAALWPAVCRGTAQGFERGCTGTMQCSWLLCKPARTSGLTFIATLYTRLQADSIQAF